jgi:hypothetical protein
MVNRAARYCHAGARGGQVNDKKQMHKVMHNVLEQQLQRLKSRGFRVVMLMHNGGLMSGEGFLSTAWSDFGSKGICWNCVHVLLCPFGGSTLLSLLYIVG